MIFFLIYLAVAALFILPSARYVLDDVVAFGEPEGMDYALATVLGFLIANFWPLILLGIPFVRALRKPEPADDKDSFTQ